MKIWLPTPQDVVRGFFFERDSGRRGLEERDRAVLALLRPHLASIRERWERRHRPPLLTAREIHVLELVAEGLTQRRSRRQACDLTYHRPRAARKRVRQTRRPHAHSCGRVAQRRTKNLIAPDGERARHAIPSFRLALVGPLATLLGPCRNRRRRPLRPSVRACCAPVRASLGRFPAVLSGSSDGAARSSAGVRSRMNAGNPCDGAAPESNRPSVGLPHRTGLEAWTSRTRIPHQCLPYAPSTPARHTACHIQIGDILGRRTKVRPYAAARDESFQDSLLDQLVRLADVRFP